MTMQRCLLLAYAFLLRLYPPAFRRRFASEMLQVAEAADPIEWLWILGDTSLAIVRCWLEPGVPHSAAANVAPDAYLGLGESGPPAARIFQGFVFSMMLALGICYAASLGYLEPPHECPHAAAAAMSR